ncbi:MAG TPA: 4-alpha-glucanotransferase, partial [Steroidobacteraceae bacterium]|nr:4-alpha-glucanotransferase [Steroidobacteraceae bacterium]
DVATLAQEAGCPQAQAHVATEDFQRSLSACRAAAQVDYAGVARLKFPMLRVLFDWISARQGGHWTQFLAYRQAAGETFERHCLFLALRAHFAARHPAAPDWRQWPEGYRSPQGAGTREFAQAQATEVTFQAWLQYVADRQLQQAARAAAPLEVGLYRDLAVGADSSGAETWSNQRAVVRGAEVGAPPDIYNPQGQDWGLPPFNPLELKREAYRSFIELLRANMRHAGGLRIDHVMALQHLYWIPQGATPGQGAYVRYPLEDLIGVLALESHRNRCLVVGEDLGTVPAGFRERMSAAAILSYRVLAFEKDAEGFVPPERYPHLSLAVAGSHDLPTLRGWWRASDLDLKEELDLFPTPQLQREARQDRDADRRGVLEAFGQDARHEPLQPQEFVEAAHEYLAATASALVMVQIDDITGEETPVNVPTTSDQYPNWRRRLSLTLEQLQQHPGLQHLARRLKAVRGGQDNGGRCTDTHSAPGP